ncbi:DUF3868 domain-containing protein [Parabacteroides chongii]|uniref:DUF3868 domain-containing protein n=1 Tax=Parabacteroides chongii TaxID=2685834 RepID=UPI00240DDEDC|nr:DUF3868 domain-containing protein [Parabacteroides chongii]WFE84237.1 DUF3868 domain-containing protein [Parabacteroides chongii]
MRIYLLHIIMYAFVASCTFLFAGTAVAEGVRIVPKSFAIKNDSLHIWLDMDLNSVHVNSQTAVIFTPELKGKKGNTHLVPLPPVIITGSKRYRYERRERALAIGKETPASPFLVLLENSRTGSKTVSYKVTIPYTSWMQQASLLLRQELKDCCDLQLLGVDTLTRQIRLKNKPATTPVYAEEMPQPVIARAKTSVAGNIAAVTAPADLREVTVPATVPVQRPVPAITNIVLSSTALDTYASMVSFLTPASGRQNKRRSKSATLYIDYPLGKDEVYPEYRNNREEIDKIDASLLPVLSEGFTQLECIRIKGCASPDGNYGDNERLAENRSRLFAWYVQRAYDLPAHLFDVSSVAEDWDGLEEILRQTKPSYYRQAIDIIHRYGIFSGREKHLMDLQGGAPYKDMLKRLFPKLRRIEFTVEYRIRPLDAGEASEMIYTHPDLLSLEEMYDVARYYRPGTDQYREVYEVAAFHFPDEVTANVNAASAVMLTGDLKSAWNYLSKVEADPRAWNNIGVLTLMEGNPEGAAVWFRKAVGIDPRKARKNLQIAEGMISKSSY